MGGYNALLEKLDEFIRKYYKSRIIRGLLYGTGLILGFFLLFTLLEYFGRFDTGLRTFMFWAFVASSGYILFRFIFQPTFKLLKIGSQISREDAAEIIGVHFSEVKDKLLNTLQLHEIADGPDHSDLIEASIEQKISELKPIPFSSAIDLSENRKYLKYVIPPLAIVLILLFAAPSVLKDSTDRLVRHREHIELQAPFIISVLNKDLSVPENEDFKINIEVDGEVIPDRVYIVLNGSRFKLSAEDKKNFAYTFRDVRKDTPFQFYADGFYTREYTLSALPVPGLLEFDVRLDYPAYVGRADESISNSGDLTIPAGTKVSWTFETKNTDKLNVQFEDSTYSIQPTGENTFSFERRFVKNSPYSLMPENAVFQGKEPISYNIRVVADRFPMIAVQEERDSLSEKHLYFTGEVKDDYGFRRLAFGYKYTSTEDDSKELNKLNQIEMRISKNSTNDRFYFHWNLEEIGIKPGDQISYFFEVWDNDGVNGSKSSKSSSRTFNAPTLDQLQDKQDEQSEEIKDELEKGIKQAEDMQKDLDELRKQLLEKEELNWQDRKKIEDILNKQKALQETVKSIQEKNDQKNFQKSEFQPQNEDLMEKQKKLQELFEQVMTDEMKEMYDELQRLMEELDKEEIQEQLENMDMSTEDMEMELDRALEQFKQMEWEQKMEDTIEKLAELAEKQEELSEKTEDQEADQEELKEEQEKLNEEFEELREELDELKELNEELENPNAMMESDEKEESIQQEMQDSSEQLEKEKNKKASESQKGASQQMKEMADQMAMMMGQDSAEQDQENLDDLRDLLENIITLSFDQEELMQNIREIDKRDPKYVEYGQVQRKLKDDAAMVEDSLFALSKRVIQIEPIVLREMGLINSHMEDAIGEIGERRTPKVSEHQQYVMTSFNNLALLLDEALKQMMEQMAQQQPGQGNCEKPGGMGSKPSASDMKKMQEALSKQLEQMKEQMGKDGKGGKGQPKKPGMSKEIAQMAARQAAIRKEIEKMGQQLNEDGSKSGNSLKEIAKEMEEVEKDLVNFKVDQETLKRQEDILIRLLKAENAEREREQDDKRRSREATEQQISNPVKFSEYQERKQKEVEMLKTVPPALKPYYREKVNDYFNKLGD